ncbi:MAG: cardiolipin synthase, partial [Odoribacter sp.]|nr:cardiolipin synthase [Odoribacter sp.]
ICFKYCPPQKTNCINKPQSPKNKERAEVRKLMTLLLNNSKALLTRFNRIQVLHNGEETFQALFQALEDARKFIHLEYYIIAEGRLTARLKDILLRKAREGVEIRIIYDDVGSWSLSKEFIREVRKAGIQIYPFLPVRFHHFANKANYRNHRKIAVIDGKTGFVGGLNIADRYVDGLPNIGIWRDTHLKVEGEAVTSLQVVFLIDWYFVRQELLLNKNEYLPYIQMDNHVLVQTVASGPDSDWASIQQTYFTLINMAKRYVFISTPYFMPGETTLNSLKTAAMSGVDVRLLLPHKSDSRLTHWCTRSYVQELLEAGVKIYWYRKGINHCKVIIVDGQVASVGTANMDLRSFEQNFEVSLIIYDREVVKELATDFIKDLQESTNEVIQKWKFRSKKEQLYESVARLFAPLL